MHKSSYEAWKTLVFRRDPAGWRIIQQSTSPPRQLASEVYALRALREGRPLYVAAGANGRRTGAGWPDAFTDLKEALDMAVPGHEIWVAAGAYKPARSDGERAASFHLKSGVALYGGFAGTERKRDERDPETNETTLSGDLNGDDGPDFANSDENSYHVVVGSACDQTAILDSFTITGGNADGHSPDEDPLGEYAYNDGGGMYNRENGSPTVANCIFVGNSANDSGGGMYNRLGSNPTLTNCLFRANSANDGGGMYNQSSSPELTGCMFADNSTIAEEGWGGGICNRAQSNPRFTGCSFLDNVASHGGAMANDASGPTLFGCEFIRNSTHGDEGWSGGMDNVNSNPTLVNCSFLRNWAGYGGGVGNGNSAASFTNCSFVSNSARNNGGGMINWGLDPILANCTFSANSADGSGGGICTYADSSPSLTNCILWSNSDNGGVDETAQSHGSTTLVNYCCIQGWTGNLGRHRQHRRRSTVSRRRQP